MGSALGRGSGGYFAGVRAGVPFALVVGVVAFSFGVLARSLGWGVIAPIVFSVVTYSAAAQFAVAMVLGAGGGALTAIAAAVLLNARFLPIGVSVTPFLFPNTSWRSFAASASPDLS